MFSKCWLADWLIEQMIKYFSTGDSCPEKGGKEQSQGQDMSSKEARREDKWRRKGKAGKKLGNKQKKKKLGNLASFGASFSIMRSNSGLMDLF